MNCKQFYVYLLRDPRHGRDKQPFYVGKGHGRRVRHHSLLGGSRHKNPLMRGVLGKIFKDSLKPIVEMVRYFEVEADAFQLEIELIAKHGRRDLGLGSLCNLTDGGEGQTGNIAVKEALRKLHTNPEFAKRRDDRTRKMHADPGFAEALAKRGRESMTKLWDDPDFAVAQAEHAREVLRKQKNNPEFVRVNKEASRAACLKRNADPEFKLASRELCLRRNAAQNADPEFKQASRERMRKLNANPKIGEANGERGRQHLQKLRADPEYAKTHAKLARELCLKRNADPANGNRMRKLWGDPEWRANMLAKQAAARQAANLKFAYAEAEIHIEE